MLTCDHVNNSGALTSCLGFFKDLTFYGASGLLENDNLFLLCSDGFYKKYDFSLIFEEKQFHSKSTIDKLLNKMTCYVKEKGEKDNITIAVVKAIRLYFDNNGKSISHVLSSLEDSNAEMVLQSEVKNVRIFLKKRTSFYWSANHLQRHKQNYPSL